jgi:hypothetical protein
MKKKLIAGAILAALLSTTALADTSSMNSSVTGMGILENDYVRAGVNGTTGTLGSGGRTSPGLLYDSTGTGTFNTAYDYLTPGSPFDGFAIKIDGTNSTNNNTGGASWTDADGLTDSDGSLTWTGTNSAHSGWEIQNTYSLGATAEHIEIGTQITAGSDATALSFGRFIDPDARAAAGDSSSTDNVLGYGVIPDTNVAFSEALSSRYALGLYSTDSNVDAGITRWTTDADSYTENAVDSDGSNTNTGDNTIGLSWNWSSVSSGDILTASYAYIFGPSAFDAADAAITAGAGGGADTSSWGTLEDVGSATDAAEGTSEPVITTETVVDTSMPVLTQAQTTHDSTTAAGVQTIARETTTIVTTPMVTNTYTDGTLTSSAAADSVAVSTVTDPGAFVGRMDQADQMLGLNAHRNLGIGEGITGSRITHDMGNGYSAESNVLSLGGHTVLDNGARISAGLNQVNTTMTGEASSGTIETMILSREVGKHIDSRDITITGNANIANGDMNYSRSIGDFDAAGKTSNKDMWGGLTVEKSTGQVRPFAGITVGKKSTDAYDETGDVQATLSHAAVDETYRYGTLGFNLDTGIFTASISKDFGDSEAMRIGVGIDRVINDRISLGVDASRITDGNNTSNRLSAGIKIQF